MREPILPRPMNPTCRRMFVRMIALCEALQAERGVSAACLMMHAQLPGKWCQTRRAQAGLLPQLVLQLQLCWQHVLAVCLLHAAARAVGCCMCAQRAAASMHAPARAHAIHLLW